MKKSELIQIIKEEISNILSEEEAMVGSGMSDNLENMSKEEMKSVGAKKLLSLYNAQCEDKSSEKCNLAREVYLTLNPTGSI